MRTRSTYPPSPEFERVLKGEDRLSLERVALEIARDAYPDLDVDAYLAKIDRLAERARDRCRPGASPRAALGQINWALFIEEEYKGNTEDYHDPRNSFLNEVIDRKTGIPISLSVLYWAIADRLGVALSAVNLPMHFVLRAEDDQGPLFIDPFHGGEFLDRNGCERLLSRLSGRPASLSDSQVEPVSIAEVVARILRNLKAIYFMHEDYPAALQVQRRLAAVVGEPEEMRDLAMLCLQLERPGEAIDPLKAYLTARPEADDARVARHLLDKALAIIARWN